MTDEQRDLILQLRQTGHAVVVFNPGELREANPADVESRLVEYGWDTIDYLSPQLP